MTESQKSFLQARTTMRVQIAATFLYCGYRILGASREHAWERARVDTARAIIDKVVEITGVIDPRNADRPGIQAHLEGGPYDGTTRFVDDCGAIGIVPERPEDARQHVYRLTDRKFGQQKVFTYHGLQVPTARASQIDAVG